MTKHDYKQHAYYMIYLIRCVLHDQIPKKEKLDKIDLSKLYEVAEKHSLTAITAYALESAGVVDERFTQAKAKSIRKEILFDIERERVLSELEKAEIWYMPLKGIILKEYYPKTGMRQMCDNDILFDKNRIKDVKEIMSDLGFIMKHDDSGHDIIFYKKPVFNFEMHTHLFGTGHSLRISEYYNSVKNRLLKCNDCKYCYHFSTNDCYVYLIAHEYNHFNDYGGTGLRSLVDKYIYLHCLNNILNMSYIEAEMKKLALKDYENVSRNLSNKLFNGLILSEEESSLFDYYLFSGTYGTTRNLIKNKLAKIEGTNHKKIKYSLSRLFVPICKNNAKYMAFKNQYPTFYNHPVLLPVLPLYRLFFSLYKSRKRITTEIKTLIKL